jgi:hypothetical protein
VGSTWDLAEAIDTKSVVIKRPLRGAEKLVIHYLGLSCLLDMINYDFDETSSFSSSSLYKETPLLLLLLLPSTSQTS